MTPITQNTLFYGDNLKILREYISDESIDLIYLDPPFNSNRNYNVLFREESGQESESQITAFGDTWHWDRTAEDTYHELATTSPPQISRMIGALRDFIGANQMMAYLVMMSIRLIELHRVLKPTGSLYLHCDPTADHYLRIIADTIFGTENFRNQVIWQRTNAKGLAFTRFASNHDVIFCYAKTGNVIWNPQYTEHKADYLEKFYRFTEPDTGRRYRLDNLANPNKNRPNLTYEFLGVTRVWRWTKERMQDAYEKGLIIQSKPGSVPALKRYLDEQEGTPIGDIWTDILPVQSQAAERLGYPTQKPLALLERIIQASSNEGDRVLDPFAGCGTTIAAAEKLNRKWIGIDITHLAISLLKNRLMSMKQEVESVKNGKNYIVIGEPGDLAGARQLADDDRYQFQWWADGLVGAMPVGTSAGSRTGKKGADRGIDGIITFIDDADSKPKRVLVQVKSGKVSSRDIRDMVGTADREKAAIGVFITLNEATKDMRTEAVSAGHYFSEGWNRRYPRIQILTIGELLNGAKVDMPPIHATFKKARTEKKNGFEQNGLPT
ncbi:MAG: site-specific DNA-methyltransferase [Desulfobacteraceae bacterium]|nr:site-specific DNA-methyltransferase [Desulfobacteraceae bacterium]